MISVFGGVERVVVPWMGAESRALPLQQNEAPNIAGGCSAGRELPPGCGSLCCKHAQASAQHSVVPSLNSTEEVFWDAH